MMDEKIENMTTEEIFKELKSSIKNFDINDLNAYQQNLIIALNNAIQTEQKVLLEQCMFFHDCLKKEIELIDLGFNKYIYKEDLEYIIDVLSKKNDKNIFFIELEDFPRLIPKEVVEKIKKLKKKKIFDKYYVLYTDYTKKAKEIAKNGNKKVTKEKDPIIFGAFTKESQINHYMGERIYYIADWIDEYCDLTLEKLLNVVPDKVHSLYSDSKEININIINEIKDLPIGQELYKNINNLRAKKANKFKTIFNFIKGLFQ